MAIQREDISLIKTLIDYRCDPNKPAIWMHIKCAPLLIAAANGNIKIVNLLLEEGADLNRGILWYGTTASQAAVDRGT
ncbi:hypothetical protein BDW68DRAFT_153831 [Aspergillus falconensis]